MRVEDYVRQAGNGTRNADLKHLLVVRADGSIMGPSGRLWASGRASLKSERVLPGDTIVIPVKLPSQFCKNLQLWTQVAGQLAITAASLAVVSGF